MTLDARPPLAGKSASVLRRARVALPALLPGLALIIAGRTYRAETNLFYPPRRPVRLARDAVGIADLAEVAFPSQDGTTLRGWYVPSKNRAGVVLAHGAGGDRSQLVPEARALTREGFGVLAFDSPGHGESDGEVHWNQGERAALRGAIDWVSGRPDVDPARLGAYGFSMGGYVVVQVAAIDRRLSAVAVAGAPPDLREQVALQHARWGPVSRLPALLAVRRGGLALDEQRPKDLIGKIAPRPVLVVTGASDPVVPESLARELHAAARSPKELLVLPLVGHGGYEAWENGAYPSRLAAFFTRALLNERPGAAAQDSTASSAPRD